MSGISELTRAIGKFGVPKVTLTCHPEAQPKDLANEKEILRFAQNDSFAVTLGTPNFSSLIPLTTHYSLLTIYYSPEFKVFRGY